MKKFLAILLLALLAFSGCSLFGKEGAPEPQAAQEISADSILDNQIYEQAVNASDLEACDRILEEGKKEECKSVINGTLLTQKAVEKMDSDMCDEIKLERYKENCEALIASENDRLEEQEEEIAQTESYNEIGLEAAETGDVEKCDKIDEENTKYSCRYNVLANKAVTEKNKELCGQIGEETLIEQCYDFFDSTVK